VLILFLAAMSFKQFFWTERFLRRSSKKFWLFIDNRLLFFIFCELIHLIIQTFILFSNERFWNVHLMLPCNFLSSFLKLSKFLLIVHSNFLSHLCSLGSLFFLKGRTDSLLKAGRLKSAIIIKRLKWLALRLSILFRLTPKSWWLPARARDKIWLLFDWSFAGFIARLLLNTGLRRYSAHLSPHALSTLRSHLRVTHLSLTA
jgi:phosphate starvation-inducible membrane PsiE